MNKHLIVIGVVILLLAVGLSGCNEEQSVDESNFIGSWSSVDFSAEYIENESEFNITM